MCGGPWVRGGSRGRGDRFRFVTLDVRRLGSAYILVLVHFSGKQVIGRR